MPLRLPLLRTVLLACALLPATPTVSAADAHRAKPAAKAVQAKAGKPVAKPAAARSIDALDRAREAYARGDLATLQMLLPQVADQPLGDYVLLWSLTQRLGRSTETVLPQEIDAFLARHGDDALGERLRRELLRAAVRDGRWSEALRHYRALAKPDRDAQCWGTLAWIQDRPQSGVPTNDVLRLLVSTPRPGTECLPLFATAAFQGRLDRQTLRQRLYASLAQSGLGAAQDWRELAGMSDDEWRDVELATRTPAAALAQPAASPAALAAALIALEKEDPEAAHERLTALGDRLEPEARDIVRWSLVLYAAKRRLPQANAWADEITLSPLWIEPARWAVRAALAAQDWVKVWQRIEALPPGERERNEWRYWQGYALKQLGKDELAEAIFRKLERGDDYYAMLAARALGHPWRLPPQSPPPSQRDVLAIERHPVLVRILALAERNWLTEANREIDAWSRKLPAAQMRAAALALSDAGHLDLAIRLAEGTDDDGFLVARYPLAYRELVERYAAEQNIDPAWVWGLMRQESRFRADARSSSGALGLMQIMPATGKWLAGKLGIPRFDVARLRDPDTNVMLGVTYMRMVTEQLDGHPVLATGAYNAGPGRMGRLRPQQALETEIYIENLPIDETRDYIKKVLANTVVYSAILNGGRGKDITEFLLPLPGLGNAAGAPAPVLDNG